MSIIKPILKPNIAPSSINLKDGLVSAWELEENGASVAYDAVSTNHGTITGASVGLPSVARGYSFASTNYVTISSSIDLLNNDSSVSFWFKRTNGTDAYPRIFTKTATGNSEGFDIVWYIGKIYITIWNGGSRVFEAYNTTTVSLNIWYHIVVTFDSTTPSNSKIYVNGVNTQTTSATHGVVYTNDNIILGTSLLAAQSYYIGLIDQTLIYNRALSQQEVSALYNAGNGLKYEYFDTTDVPTLVVEDSHGSNHGLASAVLPQGSSSVPNLGGNYEFNGTSDYIDLNSATISGTMSRSVWIKTTVTGENYIISVNNSTTNTKLGEIGLLNGYPRHRFRSNTEGSNDGTSAVGTTLVNDNNWHHLVGIITSSTISLYVDGVLEASETLLATYSASDYNTHTIAALHRTSYLIGYTGLIDQPLIYSKALSASEVTQLYNSGNGLPYASFDTGLKTGLVSAYEFNTDLAIGTQLDLGLVSAWELDETGLAVDARGGNHGTIVGPTLRQPSVARGYSFNGTNSAVVLPINTSQFGNSISISTWFKSTKSSSGGSNQGIVSNDGPWIDSELGVAINISSGLNVHVRTVDGSGSITDSAIVSNNNTWHHAVTTYDGSNFRLYVDGVLKGTDPITGNLIGVNNLEIGHDPYNTDTIRYFGGSIDQTLIYNRALSQQEITALYNRGNGLKYEYFDSGLLTNLVSCWELDETLVVPDIHGNNNGTASGPLASATSVANLGTAIEFNGVSDYINIPYNPSTNIASALSLCAWVYPNAITGDVDQIIIEKWDDTGSTSFGMRVYNGRLSLTFYGSGWTSFMSNSTELSINTWNFITVTYTSSTVILYVNGSVVTGSWGGNADHTIIDTTHPIRLGGGIVNQYFDGSIDQPLIYSKALTQSEITQLYNSGAGLHYDNFDSGLLTGLVSAYNFDEVLNKAVDAHSTNDGTTTGATPGVQGIVSNLEKCYGFDGSGDIVNMNSLWTDINSNTSGTMSMWIKISVDEAVYLFMPSHYVNGSHSGLVLWDTSYTGASGLRAGYEWNTSTTDLSINSRLYGSTDLNDGLWHNVIWQSNGTTNKIYVDGTEEIVSAWSGTNEGTWFDNIDVSIDRVTLGALEQQTGGIQLVMNGNIDQPAIWNRVLTQSEITQIYHSGNGLNFTKWDNTLKTGLVSLWNMNEGIAVDTHSTNDGTIVGATPGVQGIVSNLEKCYSFNGTSSDYVRNSGASYLSNTQGSISVWAKYTAYTTGMLVHMGDEGSLNYLYIAELGGGNLNFRWRNGGTETLIAHSSGISALPLNVWRHVVLTSDGTIYRLYLDGIEDTNLNVVTGTNNGNWIGDTTGSYTNIGRFSSSWNYMSGNIEQPAIFNRALTQSEITQIYHSGNGLNFTKWDNTLKTGLVSLWKMDEQANTVTVYDSHGNNDGTRVGCTVNQTGIIGKAYGFNGTTAQVIYDGSILNGLNSVSFSMWLYTYTNNRNNIYSNILTKYFSTWVSPYYVFVIRMYEDDYGGIDWIINTENGNVSLATPSSYFVTINTWHHLAGTYDGSTGIMNLYWNGELLTSRTDSGGKLTVVDTPLTMGDDTDVLGSNVAFNGLIDQTLIYNRALTQAEITALYNAGSGLAYKDF